MCIAYLIYSQLKIDNYFSRLLHNWQSKFQTKSPHHIVHVFISFILLVSEILKWLWMTCNLMVTQFTAIGLWLNVFKWTWKGYCSLLLVSLLVLHGLPYMTWWWIFGFYDHMRMSHHQPQLELPFYQYHCLAKNYFLYENVKDIRFHFKHQSRCFCTCCA